MSTRQSKVDEILRRTPLETRLETAINYHFLLKFGGSLIIPLDEEGNEIKEAVEANDRAFALAEELIYNVLRDVDQWKKDGMPE